MRVTKGDDVQISSPPFVDTDDETPVATAVSCSVTREDGTVLSALTVTTSTTETGVYQATLQSGTHTTQCDRLQIAWTGTPAGGRKQTYRQEIEVVGGHYVSIPELRAEPGLSSAANVPVQLLKDVRDEVEDEIERCAGVAYVHRYQRDPLDGTGTQVLDLTRVRPAALLGVTMNGVSYATNQFSLYELGQIRWSTRPFLPPTPVYGWRNVTVTYEHGYDAPPARWKTSILAIMRQRVLDRTSERRPDVMYEAFGEGQGTRYLSFEQMVEKLVGKSTERLYVL